MNHVFVGWLAVKKTARFTYNTEPDLIGRLSSSKPALKPDEVAIKLKVTVPSSAFVTPALVAEISVPEQDVAQPEIEVLTDEL